MHWNLRFRWGCFALTNCSIHGFFVYHTVRSIVTLLFSLPAVLHGTIAVFNIDWDCSMVLRLSVVQLLCMRYCQSGMSGEERVYFTVLWYWYLF